MSKLHNKMYPSAIIIYLTIFNACYCLNYELKQVLILSRHNVRTPLSENLFEFTPKTWPNWKDKSGYLTAKGALLEGFMGEFFSSWLIREGVLNKECPDKSAFYVYANIAERTMTSAYAFVSKAFPLCNITIHHSADPHMDPIFNPIIHNKSKSFRTEAIFQMQSLLNTLHLNSSQENLEDILDYKNSKNCLMKQKCDLVSDKNDILVNVGFKPSIKGPLKISKSVIDSFIMEYYEGFPIEEVAWGRLKTTDQWDAIMAISRGYHSVIFNTSIVAKDLALPLLNYIKDLLINNRSRVTLLMGHDANIYTVLKSLQIKPYILKNQHEKIPAGGKVVFQKWKEQKSGNFFVKIDYVYQGTQQMREGKNLSMTNPPEFTLLELEGCKSDDDGLCPWDDFVRLLNLS